MSLPDKTVHIYLSTRRAVGYPPRRTRFEQDTYTRVQTALECWGGDGIAARTRPFRRSPFLLTPPPKELYILHDVSAVGGLSSGRIKDGVVTSSTRHGVTVFRAEHDRCTDKNGGMAGERGFIDVRSIETAFPVPDIGWTRGGRISLP